MAKAPNNPRPIQPGQGRTRFDPEPVGGWAKEPSYQTRELPLRNSTSREPYVATELNYRGYQAPKPVVEEGPGTRMLTIAEQGAIIKAMSAHVLAAGETERLRFHKELPINKFTSEYHKTRDAFSRSSKGAVMTDYDAGLIFLAFLAYGITFWVGWRTGWEAHENRENPFKGMK